MASRQKGEKQVDGLKNLIQEINTKRKAAGMPIMKQPTETRSIRGTYQLAAEEVEQNKVTILDIEQQQDICRGCSGDKCDQPYRGMVPVVTDNGGRFGTAMRMCRHEKAKRQYEKIERLFQSARIPAAYSRDDFDDYEVTSGNREAVAAAKWLLQSETDRGLFVYGFRGTGKTKLVSIIANNKVKRGETVMFTSMPDLLADIRASFGTNLTAETVRMAKEVPCLIIDDLGAERMTEWVGEQLFCIINARYNAKLQTIITGNYEPNEIIERLSITDRYGKIVDDMQGHRIMSRIYGMCERIRLDGRDYRMKGATA